MFASPSPFKLQAAMTVAATHARKVWQMLAWM
jgi:hypothetical protein